MIMSPVMDTKNNAQIFEYLWGIGSLFFISPTLLSSKIGVSQDKVKRLILAKPKMSEVRYPVKNIDRLELSKLA